MAGRRAAPEIVLSETERASLEWLSARRKTAQAMAMRARIVLASAGGLQNEVIASRLSVDASTVGKWRRRFAERRLDGLDDGTAYTIHDQRSNPRLRGNRHHRRTRCVTHLRA